MASLGTPNPLWYVIRDGHNGSSSVTPVALVADDEPLVPTTRIVIVSAHDDLSGLVSDAGIGVLPKPFDVRDLLEHVTGMVGLPVDVHSSASGDDATTA